MLNEIKTVEELERAINDASDKDVRKCLLFIARDAFLVEDGLDRDKDLGAEFIGEVTNHLDAFGFAPTEE